MIAALTDGKIEFTAQMTYSRMDQFDQYTGILLNSESPYGCNVSLSLEPEMADELYMKTVRVTVEVMG